jgi:regulatory protein
MKPDSERNSDQIKRERIVAELPLTITSVSPQKKNADRFSLFNGSTFLMGVSGQTLLDFSIKKGTTLSEDLFYKLIRAEEYHKAKERAYRLLSGRDHGAEELQRKLVKKGFPPQICAGVVEELQKKDLLNDLEYARKFAHDKHHLRHWGARKIEAALYNKGVAESVVKKAVRNLHENINPGDVCLEIALKRRKHFLREGDLNKRKQKIFRYLAGKGYAPDIILKSIPTILERLDAKKSNT